MAENLAAERLRSFIERIERLEKERADIGADIKEVYAEAKSDGFIPKTIREVVKLRAMDPQDRQEAEHVLGLYRDALGV